MSKFRVVYDQAVWERASVVVEAENAEEAEALVLEGQGDLEWTAIDEAVFNLDCIVQSVEEAEDDAG